MGEKEADVVLDLLDVQLVEDETGAWWTRKKANVLQPGSEERRLNNQTNYVTFSGPPP